MCVYPFNSSALGWLKGRGLSQPHTAPSPALPGFGATVWLSGTSHPKFKPEGLARVHLAVVTSRAFQRQDVPTGSLSLQDPCPCGIPVGTELCSFPSMPISCGVGEGGGKEETKSPLTPNVFDGFIAMPGTGGPEPPMCGVRPTGTGTTQWGSSGLLLCPGVNQEYCAKGTNAVDFHISKRDRRSQLQTLHCCCSWDSCQSQTLLEPQSGSSSPLGYSGFTPGPAQLHLAPWSSFSALDEMNVCPRG